MNRERESGASEIFFFGIITAGLIFGCWFLLRKPIMWVSFYASYWCFSAYEHLSFLMTSSELHALVAARKAIPSINPTKHGLKALIQLMEYHGYIWRWIVIPLMLWIGWRTKQGVVRFKYNREINNVYDLIEIQRKHFPASAIIYKKDLLKTHPYVGPWATYSLPLDFALDNSLLWTSKQEVSADDKVNEETMVPIPPFTPEQKVLSFPVKRKMLPAYRYVAYNTSRANALFTKQLGPIWEGVDKLPPLEKALFAVFCTQAAGKQGEAWKMIEQLAFSFKEGERDNQGKLVTPHYANTSGTEKLLEKYGEIPAIRQIQDIHAHKYNVMFAALALARKKGRLLHANFLWLKPVNRTLWYVLCGQGGQSAYWEAAGQWAHHQVEELMGKKIITPMVAGAIEAMRDNLSKEHWIDPGKYSEAEQQRLVLEANRLLDEARQEKSQSVVVGMSPKRPQTNTTRRRREDDEP